jgi:60 kDa SS-A/Ro ribonucleoprotein
MVDGPIYPHRFNPWEFQMQYLSAAVGGKSPVIGGLASLSQWQELERYLILGDANGVYYAGEPRLSAESAGVVRERLAEDGRRTVSTIVEIARSGRAPRQDALLFALALAASPKYADAGINAMALKVLPEVANTATHLRKFATFVTGQRGWGRSLRSAFARWYLEKPVRELALQMLKQRRRGRWSHADLLRLSHPKPASKAQSVLFRWAVEDELGRVSEELLAGELKQVHGYERARKAADKREVIELIDAFQLTHEMIPDRWLGAADVWEALLDTMPYCAMLRNLGRLTAAGLIAPQGEVTALVAARLVDHRRIVRAKANPVTLLSTLLEYRQSHGVPAICAALETAFYASFTNMKPAGGHVALRLDGGALIASTVMAMLVARTEPSATILPDCVAKQDRLDTVMAAVQSAPAHSGGCPDGAALVAVTGDGRWTAEARPAGIPLVMIAPNAKEPPVANPTPSMLQVVGFDATVPAVVADFIRG